MKLKSYCLAVLCFMSVSGLSFSQSAYFTVDEDSIRLLGDGCPEGTAELTVVGNSVNIIFLAMDALAFGTPATKNCSVLFDVTAAPGYKIAAPQVEMQLEWSIDDGGKGIATAKLTTLGESRSAGITTLTGDGAGPFSSPVAPSPAFSSCGGTTTFRVAGYVAAIPPQEFGTALVKMDEGNFSIRCPVIYYGCN